uniref:Uncharacterized protein n=1 Tax=Denticeps clupeoides TaxID=299321 RepID=A0AAY4BPD5_9TELE
HCDTPQHSTRPPLSPQGHHCPRKATIVPARPPLSPQGHHCPRKATTVPARPPLSPPPLTPQGHHCPRKATTDPARPPLSPQGHHRLVCSVALCCIGIHLRVLIKSSNFSGYL